MDKVRAALRVIIFSSLHYRLAQREELPALRQARERNRAVLHMCGVDPEAPLAVALPLAFCSLRSVCGHCLVNFGIAA
jgi:hypothetical protein